MNSFSVKFYKTGKPKGSQRFLCHNVRTYEEVLFNHTLSDLCLSSYHHHYDWVFLNEIIFINRVRANAKLCVYEVSLFDMRNKTKLISEYQVEIDCKFNDGTEDIFEQDQVLTKISERKFEKPQKRKWPTDWYIKEPRAIKDFLFWLNNAGSLKELKKTMPKATYYRNLKLCQERGHIKGGKLVKRIFVTKSGYN